MSDIEKKSSSILLARLNYVLLLLISFTLPFGIILNSVLIILATSIFIGKLIIERSLSINKHEYLFIISLTTFLSLRFFWLINTEDLERGFLEVEKSLSLLVLPFIIFNAKLNSKEIKNILLTIVFSCLLVSIILQVDVILIFLNSGKSINLKNFIEVTYHERSYPYIVGTIYVHPSYLGLYINFSILFLLNLLHSGKINRPNKVLLTLISIYFLVVFIIEISSASAVFSLVLILACYSIVFLRRKETRKATIYTLMLPIVLIISTIIINPTSLKRVMHRVRINFDERYNEETIKNFSPGYSPNNRDTRLEIWQSGFQVFQQNYIFGVGSGDIKIALEEQYKKDERKQAIRRGFGTHNQFLDISIGHGIVGLFLFFLGSSYFIITAYKTRNLLYFMFLSIFFLGLLSENLLSRQKGIVYFALVNSLLFNWVVSINKTDNA